MVLEDYDGAAHEVDPPSKQMVSQNGMVLIWM
jgi:hypothetical protein